MRAEDFLDQAERLPLAGLQEILGSRGVVVVAPHPDDESLGCGGLIAQASAQGTAVRIVVVSDGVGSHPGSICYPPVRLKVVREAETLKAALNLGLESRAVTFLGLPDREVPAEGPRALAAAEQIASIAKEIDAGTLLVTWKHDPHCDHQAAHALARHALRLLGPGVVLRSYPIWGRSLPPDQDVGAHAPSGVRLDISAQAAAKRAAITAHASQTGRLIHDDPGGFQLDPKMIERFATSPEIYLDEPS
ncbi:PIG-L deacetylase family protein [Geminicoccus roseus]|uniref:PIG-L deacetylase family protein n=1 Tax=Geminicoccus roseus TaxID=404900 RepID=UPI0004261B1D|nr:PIG-L family deacetylase [Geminicoccus roseus]